MKRIIVSLLLLIGFMSFAFRNQNEIKMKTNIEQKNKVLKTKHIDITLTATNGCTIHVVGDLDFSIIPPRVNGFQGTVTIGGPRSCPQTILTINYAAKNVPETRTGLEFDSPVLCDIKTATWFPGDKSYTEVLNDKNVNEALINEIKKDDCFSKE